MKDDETKELGGMIEEEGSEVENEDKIEEEDE